MLKLTKTGIGLLTRLYRSVLKKCWMINVGLWQAMGDAVSKAVSVPARLIASLLSGGTMSGEAFNALDKILLSRLFERKLSSLTAVGLTIAAVTMPSNAEAATPTEVLNLLNTGNETWTISGSSEQGTSFNPSTKTATGTVGIKVNDTITYYTYTYTTPYTSSDAIENLSGNVVNKYFYNYSYAASNYSDQNYSVTADFIKNAHVGLYNYAGSMASISGNFIGNITSVEGSAIHVANQGTIDNVTGDFIANITQGEQSADGALLLDGNSRINTVNANFIANVANRSAGAIDNEGGSSIGVLLGNFIGNAAIYSPSQYAGNSFGGAINNGGTIGDIGSSTKSVNFYSNYVSSIYQAKGGAIRNTGVITNIGTSSNKVTFSGNYAQSTDEEALGGAIYNEGTIGNIYANFTGNHAESGGAGGGAIYNGSSGIISKVTGVFLNNNASVYGGAIRNRGKITITDSEFTANHAGTDGGAILNHGKMIIKNSTFNNNTSTYGAGVYGYDTGYTSIRDSIFTGNSGTGAAVMSCEGAIVTVINSQIYNNNGLGAVQMNKKGIMTLIDTSITGQSNGYGAYFGVDGDGGILNIVANGKNIELLNNINNNEYIDVYMNVSNSLKSRLNLNAAANRQIKFNGKIGASSSGGILNINQSGLTYKDLNDDYSLTENSITQTGGNYIFNNAISGVDVNLYNNANIKFGSLLQNNNTTTYGSFALAALTNDANGGYIDMRNSHIENNSAATLTLGSQLKIGLDIQHPTSGTTGTADNITFTTGSGSILIDAINEIGTRPTATGTYLYQVLNGSGVTLALTDAIKTEWNTDTTTSSPKVRDSIAATTAWTDKIYNRWTDTRVQGSLDVSGNNLVYSVINTQTAQSEVAGDTLALVTTATNNASRIFSTTDATAEYLLSTNLGAVNAVYKNLSINGTVSGDNRSTLNLGNYNGFYLDSSDDNLSLSSMKVSGGNDYSVNLANSGSNLNVANVIMDSTAAPITGAGNVEFTGTNEINTKVLNTGTTTVSSGTTDFNEEVAGFTVSAPATVSIAADDITAETTNDGTLELEGGNVTTKLMGAGRMKLMSGNVRLLSSTPPATTGSLSFGSSSDYADSILISSSEDSTSDHALVTAGYLDNNYYMNYGFSMTKSFIKAANDNNFTTLNCVKEA